MHERKRSEHAQSHPYPELKGRGSFEQSSMPQMFSHLHRSVGNQALQRMVLQRSMSSAASRAAAPHAASVIQRKDDEQKLTRDEIDMLLYWIEDKAKSDKKTDLFPRARKRRRCILCRPSSC